MTNRYSLDDIDLTSPAFHESSNPVALWNDLRSVAPQRCRPRNAETAFWIVTTYDEALRVYKDQERYTSIQGNMLDTLLNGGDPASGKMLVISDGPDHKRLKKAIANIIDRKLRGRLPLGIGMVARRLVRSAVDAGQIDFASAVSDHIPIFAISELLDIPDGDRSYLHGLASRALSSAVEEHVDRKSSQLQLLEYFSDLIRRPSSDGDFWSELKASSRNGDPLTLSEMVLNAYSLLLGGDETTRLAISGAAKALAENPGEWTFMRTQVGATGNAVEEVLRWTSPAMHVGRSVTSDHDVHGVTLRQGDPVAIWNISANYDPDQFSAPHMFNLRRSPIRHLSFGYSAHFCIGAMLARVEIHAVLDALVEAVGSIEIAGDCKRVYSNFTYGYSRVPLYLAPQ